MFNHSKDAIASAMNQDVFEQDGLLPKEVPFFLKKGNNGQWSSLIRPTVGV